MLNTNALSIAAQLPSSENTNRPLPYWVRDLLAPDANNFLNYLGSAKTFYYNFPTKPPSYIYSGFLEGFKPFNAPQQAFVRDVFKYISSVIDVKFVESNLTQAPNTIAFLNNLQDSTAAYANYPSTDPNGSDVSIAYDPGNKPAVFKDGEYLSQVLIHELGHALGLKHPFEPEGLADGLSEAPLLPSNEDNTLWTVMSYTDNAAAGYYARYSPLDIAALQYLYGPSKAQQSNDIIKLNPDAPNFIWDGGGIDTLDGSALTQSLSLSLEPGSWGTIGPKSNFITSAGQIAINYGTRIENILSGSGNDRIQGNADSNLIDTSAGNDTVIGSAGVDTINGGSGLDTVILSGTRANYQLTKTVGAWNFSGDSAHAGSNVLMNVERVNFTDKTLALDIDGVAGQAYRLYQAAFDRKPDLAGLGFWINALDRGFSLPSVASGFIGSAEYQMRLGPNPSNTAQVVQIYANVLHRVPDLDGFNFWKGHLDYGDLGLTQLLINFSESSENQAQVIGSIQNGIEFTPFA